MNKNILLSTAYFGPVSYFSKFLSTGQVILEKHENYIKQTYRNRCLIYGPNGSIALTVPVKRGSFHKVAIKDLEIDNGKQWQKLHFKTIEASYKAAPFYEFYTDDLNGVIFSNTRYLWDLNIKILDLLLNLIGIRKDYSITTSYMNQEEETEVLDYRKKITPKNAGPDPFFTPIPYPQVFGDRFGFIEDLSILDLLFNAGPESCGILERSIKD